jgi:hypothetical protein
MLISDLFVNQLASFGSATNMLIIRVNIDEVVISECKEAVDE